jgi:hypothetical protein
MAPVTSWAETLFLIENLSSVLRDAQFREDAKNRELEIRLPDGTNRKRNRRTSQLCQR